MIVSLSHFTCSSRSAPSLKPKPIVQKILYEALGARLSRFKTLLSQNPYLVLKAPYRRSGQALTTRKEI